MASDRMSPPLPGAAALPAGAPEAGHPPAAPSGAAPAAATAGPAARDVSGPVLDFIESLHGPTGKVLKAAYRLGGVRLLHSLVLQPLLIALLAAFWMLMLSKVPWEPVQQVRGWFVELIHDGFAVRDAAEKTSRRDNRLIDFVQVIDFDLTRGLPQKAVPLLLDLNRKVRLDVKLAEGHPPACTGANAQGAVDVVLFLKSKRAPIEEVSVDDKPETFTRQLDADWWQRFGPILVPDASTSREVAGDLTLRRSDAGAPVDGCDSVRGRLQISVFKTHVEVKPAAAGAGATP